ncbi:esterase [Salipiger aestuarii]|uniref:alpha/beta fold hydrolase n=1 Tax=Salipiger aestuarii TaxID=568098 RepID=UPI00025B8AAE|nr:alpha/beta fold hydrolase [Salipiger aestuarii]EIE49485.1 esterase EstC, putative [Citreicella sp. 357]KAA8610084.1 esterase [Salipiger aestuarii]KAA8616109.1 esterase [Salipiger aestuarii]
MARMLLVAGACHGAWAWDALVPHLVALGHDVPHFDLPAHGDDPQPAAGATLGDYAGAIAAALLPGTILLAHSMAGVPATLAAELAPDRVARLVYLCAYLPQDGDSVTSLRRQQDSQPLKPALRRTPEGHSFDFVPELARDLFYHDCPEAVARAATASLRPEPIAPQETPVRLAGAARAVPRSYILCTQDRAIPPADQRRMALGIPAADVHARAWSHSPFLSDPAGLARLLDAIARA